jgi:hypothetical protein
MTLDFSNINTSLWIFPAILMQHGQLVKGEWRYNFLHMHSIYIIVDA